MFSMTGEVTNIGFRVTGDAVQQEERRQALVTRVKVASTVTLGVKEALGELDLG
jgi:hypothetical protein